MSIDAWSNRLPLIIQKLWPFILIGVLLSTTPAGLSLWSSAVGPRSTDSRDLATVTSDNLEKTVVVGVVVLACVGFGRLAPILWSLCQSSFTGLLIAAELGFIYWIVYGGLASVGMPGLLWHSNSWVRMRAALGATLFTYWMLYLLFVRDYEIHRHEPNRQIWARFVPALRECGLPAAFASRMDSADAVGRLRWFLAVAGLPALLALVVPALLPTMRPGIQTVGVDWAWLAGVGAGVLAAAVLAAIRAATRLHECWRVVTGRAKPGDVLWLSRDRLDPHANMRNILILITIVFLTSYIDEFINESYYDMLTARLFPAAFSMCIVLGVVATASAWLGTRRPGVRVLVFLAAAVLLAAGGALDYEVRIRSLNAHYPSTAQQFLRRLTSPDAKPSSYGKVVDLKQFQRDEESASSSEAAARSALEGRTDLLTNWRRSFGKSEGDPGGENRPILVVVATSGGALRAGAWTESVLGELERSLEDFPHHVRLIAGASGGMLGAARFVATQLHGRGMPGGPPGAPHALDAPPDYLTPIAWKIAFRDFVPNSLIPIALENRGDVLENAWAHVDEGIRTTFEALRAGEEAGTIPSIVFSPMMSEDGRRLLISNLPLADLTFNDDRALLVEDEDVLREKFQEEQAKLPISERREPDDYDLEYPSRASVSAVEFFRLFKDSRDELDLAAAARMSATFPYVTSSVVLPTFPPRHVVDAGYYDNYGVNLAGSWISRHAEWLIENTNGVLFIQIRAFPNEARLKKLDLNVLSSAPDEDSESLWGRFATVLQAVPRVAELTMEGLQSLAIPFEGIAHSRDSSMYFRNDAQVNGLETLFRMKRDGAFFRTVVFTCDTTPSDPNTPNVETLNWYMDPIEYYGIRRNMQDSSDDAATGLRTGRLRNHLRFQKLKDWWRSRGGVVREPASTEPDPES